ncbi:MAG: hypothetical protein HOY79_06490 [Streptomyces sp.]|nr:hypothetical protein [Streptomyces sp.]
MNRRPSEHFNLTIEDDGHYAERLVFTNGREGRTRVYLGRAVRDRIDHMTYTDYGEDWVYTSVAKDPDTRVITGVTTTSPVKDAHHTATWAPIATAERDAFLQAHEEKWREFWRVVASVGA